MHRVIHAEGMDRSVLTVKKILAGRGAVDYYLNQARRGLGDYYLPEGSAAQPDGAGLSAPGSAWWGGGAQVLALSGEVGRAEFEPLYSKAARPEGGFLGRRFRLPEEAAAAKRDLLLEASEITDPYERWMQRAAMALEQRPRTTLLGETCGQPHAPQ